MAKALTITPDMSAQIAAVCGDGIDTSAITVFETVAVNTKAISKRGSIFDKAQITRNTLVEMADAVAKHGGIHLHTMHLQSYELPVGKVFQARVVDNADGSSELRCLFYLPNDSQSKLIADINAGVLDEVSIGLATSHAMCSECGWDFMGDDATWEHFYDRTCANGHTVGEDGVHLNLAGVDRWYELSLVSVGAAQNAKIQSRAKALLASDVTEGHRHRLAASGIAPEATLLFATFSHEVSKMDAKDFIAALSAHADEKAAAKVALDAANAKVDELTAALEAANAKVDELTANANADVEQLKADLDGVNAQLAELTGFLVEQADKAQIASGIEAPVPAETGTKAIEIIKASALNLANTLPVGGAAQAADSESAKAPVLHLGAFTTRK